MPPVSPRSAQTLSPPRIEGGTIGRPARIRLGRWRGAERIEAVLRRGEEAEARPVEDGQALDWDDADDAAEFRLEVTAWGTDRRRVRAVSEPVVPRHAPPELLPASEGGPGGVDLEPVLDLGFAPHEIDLAAVFSGRALRFSARGGNASVRDGRLRIPATVPMAGAPVTVVAENSGGLREVQLRVTVEDEGEAPRSPVEPRREVEDPLTGVVFRFTEDRLTGQYHDGTWFVVAGPGDPVSIAAITPESQEVDQSDFITPDGKPYYDRNTPGTTSGPTMRRVHGAMVNPGLGSAEGGHFVGDPALGFDSYYYLGKGDNIEYDPARNVDPGWTGRPLALEEGSVVKAVSKLAPQEFRNGRPRLSHSNKTSIEAWAVLSVVPEIPVANAFRPPISLRDKRSYWSADDIDLSRRVIVPRLAPHMGRQKGQDTPEELVASALAAIRPVQQTFSRAQESSLRYNPGARGYGVQIYGSAWSATFDLAYKAFLANYRDDLVRDLMVATAQVGIDIHGVVRSGGGWAAWNAHHTGRKGIMMLAGVLLNDEVILEAGRYDAYRHGTGIAPGAYPFGCDDACYMYVPEELVGKQSHFTKGAWPYRYTQDHVGLPDWSAYPWWGSDSHNMEPWIGGKNYYNLSQSYQQGGPMDSYLWAMIVDPEARDWNPACFDHLDRYLGIRNGDYVYHDWTTSEKNQDYFLGNWWSIAESQAQIGHMNRMRAASPRPLYLPKLKPEPLPRPRLGHTPGTNHVDVAFNANDFRFPRHRDVPVTRYDLRWVAYADGVDVARSEKGFLVEDYDWQVIEGMEIAPNRPYRLSGLPGGEKIKVQLRMANANGAGPWFDGRFRENYDGEGKFKILAIADNLSRNLDLPPEITGPPVLWRAPALVPDMAVTVGTEVRAENAVWSANPAGKAAYRWQASLDQENWTDIPDATGASLVPGSDLEGRHLRAALRVENAEGASEWRMSVSRLVQRPLLTELVTLSTDAGQIDLGDPLGGRNFLVLASGWKRGLRGIAAGGRSGTRLYGVGEDSNPQISAHSLSVPEGVETSILELDNQGSNTLTVCEVSHPLDPRPVEVADEFDSGEQVQSYAVETVAGGCALFLGRSGKEMSFRRTDLVVTTGPSGSGLAYLPVTDGRQVRCKVDFGMNYNVAGALLSLAPA